MASAYAALVSLRNVVDHIENHHRLSNYIDEKQIASLCENVGFLFDFVESTHSHGGYNNEADQLLESQIASAACAAEDVIESHVVNQIHSGSLSLLDMQTVIEDMDYVKDKVVNALKPTYQIISAPTSSMSLTSSEKSTMVGVDDELTQLLDALTGRQSSLQIIPIVGMGGIGKTTLARNLHENRLILHHFDIRAWTAISQEYSVRDIFSMLLSFLSKSGGDLDGKNEHELTQSIYQTLKSRRYLVVLDDMWSIEAWENIMHFFPDDKNGSRIIVTTRLANLTSFFGSSSLTMSFLDEDKSWELFCQKAFPGESRPTELQKVGKKIVEKCKGLPLSIVVIGGLLRKSSRTKEYWENISVDVNSIFLNSGDDERSLDILSLSYSHLPAHLKPCFLHMGIFPEDHEIHVSELIKLWVAEGFLKPNKTQTLEEVAKDYLKDLVDRNLILICSLGWNGKIKTCNIHDLIRDLCIKAAHKEKFFCAMRASDIPQGIENKRRVVFHLLNPISHSINPMERHRSGVLRALGSSSLARSLISYGVALSFKFKMLRVVNLLDLKFDSLDDIFLEQVNLRYFYKIDFLVGEILEIHKQLPSSISLLWNLQTLSFRSNTEVTFAPPEIWEMPQLRHLNISAITLPNPPLMSDTQNENDRVVLQNLQTLKRVWNLTWSEEVCKRIPNVKKLRIIYNDQPLYRDYRVCDYGLDNIRHLHKLESLNYYYMELPKGGYFLQKLTFPSSLRKLTLKFCRFHWEDMKMIGSLPNLEYLYLLQGSFAGHEWNPVEGEFVRLKYLKIFNMELINWNADSSHFPVLENLVLERMSRLDEIPWGIGEISTLQSIELLEKCSESAMLSAVGILVEQESSGNDELRVRIELWDEAHVKRFREKVEQDFEGFTSKNLDLHFW